MSYMIYAPGRCFQVTDCGGFDVRRIHSFTQMNAVLIFSWTEKKKLNYILTSGSFFCIKN